MCFSGEPVKYNCVRLIHSKLLRVALMLVLAIGYFLTRCDTASCVTVFNYIMLCLHL